MTALPRSTSAPGTRLSTRLGAPAGVSVRAAVALAIVPVCACVAYLLFPSRQFHWDCLERAYLLEHPGRYLHTWDGSPRSLFLSFAHVLELPLAALVRLALPGASGLRALCVFEALVAAVTLAVLGWLVVFWRRAASVPGDDVTAASLPAAGLAQLTLGVALAFWKMGSSGEEKVLALATQLLFLAVFWRALVAAPAGAAARARGDADVAARARGDADVAAPARRDGGVSWGVAAALALAILSHLEGAVLVPFAAGALFLLPAAWRPRRAAVARGVVAGALGAGVVYWAIAAWTADVRGPASFVRYLTFFHRAAGNDFWEPSGAEASGPNRVVRAWTGLSSFFAGDRWAGAAALAALCGGILLAARRRPGGAAAPGAGAAATDIGRGVAPGREAGATLRRQALLLGALWSLHFVWFEPQNFESWTLVAALLVLVAAVTLSAGRVAWAGLALPLLLFATNLRHYAASHRPLDLEAYRGVVERRTHPGDIVVLVGGIQNHKPLRGSLSMRFFLATLGDRTYASLYDIMRVTQREYWDRPFESPAALQAALDAGRHAYVPGFLAPDIARANASGLVNITTEARGDSLLAITSIASP